MGGKDMIEILNRYTSAVLYSSATAQTIAEAVAECRAKASEANSWANLSWANLSWANLSRANLSWANLSGADLSGAKGFLDGCAWMLKNFKRVRAGIIVYKCFGANYRSPSGWKIEPGAVISENCNPNPTEDCGCGVNVATLEWVRNNHPNATIWRCLIRWAWLPSVVVTYNTDGKIRCGKVQLLGVVK